MIKQPMTATTTATSKADIIRPSAQLKPRNKIKIIPKKIVSLKLLLNRSLIEPEALAFYGDTCLHSTISTLWNTHNIKFDRVTEKYGRYNALFMRYSIHPDSIAAANNLVNHYEQKIREVA